MRSLLRLMAWAALTVSLLLGILGGAGYWLHHDLTGHASLLQSRIVLIPCHACPAAIAELLAERGVIRRPRSFALGAALSGLSSTLLAGEYEFPAGASPLQAM